MSHFTPVLLKALVASPQLLPQRVCGDGHNALGALLRGKTGGELQGLVGQGSQVETGLVGVAEPGAARHGQHLKRQKAVSWAHLGMEASSFCATGGV